MERRERREYWVLERQCSSASSEPSERTLVTVAAGTNCQSSAEATTWHQYIDFTYKQDISQKLVTKMKWYSNIWYFAVSFSAWCCWLYDLHASSLLSVLHQLFSKVYLGRTWPSRDNSENLPVEQTSHRVGYVVLVSLQSSSIMSS